MDKVLEHAASDKLLAACKKGRAVHLVNANFRLHEYNGYVFSTNLYDRKYSFKLKMPLYLSNPEYYALALLIPPVINTYTHLIENKPKGLRDSNFWQYPCATERQAYENHCSIESPNHIDEKNKTVNVYIPLPWATYIDKSIYPEKLFKRLGSLIYLYNKLGNYFGYKLKFHSVCQHICWRETLRHANRLGITDFHLSHKNSSSDAEQKAIGTNIALHGWPLIAVNYVVKERSAGLSYKEIKGRPFLATFIGAHMDHYRNNNRLALQKIASEIGRDDVFVDLGNEWHFNKIVYEEQIQNKQLGNESLEEEHGKTRKYNQMLSNSRFSFCPEGAGPNTLRLWESIVVGSIPVVFSDDLCVFHESKLGRELFDNLVFTKLDNNIFSKLDDIKDISERSERLLEIYKKFEVLKCF